MVILNEAKPKYEKLNELLDEKLMDIRFSTQVNVIIDLKEIIKKFFRPDINPRNYSLPNLCEEITSDIFSTVGHYRNYFYKKGKYTNFYILDSIGRSSELDSMYDGYRKDFYDKYVGTKVNVDKTNQDEYLKNIDDDEYKRYALERIIKAVSLGLKLFPHVYYISTSDFSDIAYAKLLIQNIKPNELVFILTNDQILFQLVSKNVSIITTKGIKSELITPDNLYKTITNKDDGEPFSHELLPLVLSISGVKKYSIKNINNVAINKAIVIVKSLIDSGKLEQNGTIDFPINFSSLDKSNKVENILINNKDIISLNYNIIRGDLMMNKHKKVMLDKINADIARRYSIGEIKRLNETVFKNFPLQLDMLIKGERL